MSATPRTIEEATESLQRIIDHPRTLTALQRVSKKEVLFTSQITEGSKITIINDYLWAHVSYVTPMKKENHVLVIFAQSDYDNARVQFGILDRVKGMLRPVATGHISTDLEAMQYVNEVIVGRVLGSNKEYDIPMYI